MFQYVDIQNSDAGESSKRKYAAFRTRRKYEIKNSYAIMYTQQIIPISKHGINTAMSTGTLRETEACDMNKSKSANCVLLGSPDVGKESPLIAAL